jgi:hypothetical protein
LPDRACGVTGARVRPVWTPEDASALRALADAYPREIGNSAVLAEIVEREGLAR